MVSGAADPRCQVLVVMGKTDPTAAPHRQQSMVLVPLRTPAIKVIAPRAALSVLDRAIPLHGGAGVSADTPLAEMWAGIRTLRIADGPDAVHLRSVARQELRTHPRQYGPGQVSEQSGHTPVEALVEAKA